MWPIGYVSKSLDLDCGLQMLFTQPLVIHSSLFAFFFFQEHTMIRFKDGKPMYIAPEAHGGQVVLGNAAFNFDVLEKKDNRPIVYSANGTHGVFISLPFKRPIQPQNDSSLTKKKKKTPFPSNPKMYPEAGVQNYTGLPIPIYDETDKGHLWDLTLNYEAYYYSNEAGFSYTGNTPAEAQDLNALGWLEFLGYWGDKRCPVTDSVSHSIEFIYA